MPAHAEKRVVPYTPEQMFDVVADIERYPEFLPWCVATQVRPIHDNVIYADMMIGFRMFRERFTTRDVLERPRRILVAHHQGPFKRLHNHWIFEPQDDGGCLIDFFLDFEFRSRVFERMISIVFHEAVGHMVAAFERRARKIYG